MGNGNMHGHILALAAFTIIALLFTYPLILNFTKAVPGEFDTYWFLWEIWHFGHQLGSGNSPFFSTLIYYPYGTSLYLSTVVPLLSLLSIPLQWAFGLVGAYNALYLASYVLSAYFAYLLAKEVTGDARVSFVAAIIFAFAPYHSGHALRHLNLMSTQWIPLLFLAYLRLRKKGSNANALFLGISFVLVGLSEMIYLAICLIAIAFDLVLDLKNERKNNFPTVKKVALALALFAIVASPYVLGMASDLLFGRHHATSPFEILAWAHTYSPDILAFVTPPMTNPLFSGITKPVYETLEYTHWHIAEYSVYMGIVVLALVVCSIGIKSAQARWWKAILAGSLVMALGPFAKLAGVSIPIILPYTVLAILPFGHLLRVPGRFDAIVMLAAAMLAAIALKEILEKFLKSENARWIAAAAVCSLVLVEFYSPPVYFLDLSHSAFYGEIRHECGNYSLLEVPYEPTWFSEYDARIMYLQTIHQKPLAGGLLSRLPLPILESFANTSCMQHLFRLEAEKCNGTSELSGYGVKYIIVNRQNGMFDENYTQRAAWGMEKLLGKPVYTDEFILVYRVN